MTILSIITPTFNRAYELNNNLSSVSSQSFKNIEHIIIDNLSTNGTKQIIEDYKNSVSYPVIYVREKDSGISNAMNKGIKISQGIWIHILNSDDYFYSNSCLEEIFKLDNLHQYNVLACSIIVKNAKAGNYSNPWIPEYNKKNEHYNFPHPGLIIKKSFYESSGFYDERFKIISDAVFDATNMPKASYKIINNPLVISPDSGISNRFSLKKSWELFIFTSFLYKGQAKYKIKFNILNFYRDIKLILKDLKIKINKRAKN